MNCVIPGSNLKILGKALVALCRFGDELYIEPSTSKLSLRTVNMSKTAYGVIDFSLTFFSFFKVVEDTEDAADSCKCKLPMKAMLNVLRNTAHLEKNVLTCKIKYEPNATQLLLKFRYKQDITKCHLIYLLEGETLQAFYLKGPSPNNIVAASSVFQHALQNFQQADSEISADVNSSKLSFRNYINGDNTCTKMMRTQLTIHSSDFSTFNIGTPTDIRFGLKLFRASIGFADSFNLDVTINFEECGKPLIIIIKNDSTFEANFVLSTLRYDSDTQSTIVGTEPVAQTVAKNTPKRKRDESDITAQEEDLLNSINWDTDFPMDDGVPTAQTNKTATRAKKVAKIVFQRCFDLTIDPLKSQDVLVANSDDEC